MVRAWRHRRDGKVCGAEKWSGRDEGSSRHADNAELNGEQKAKELQNNPAAGFVTLDPAYGDRNTDETERRFQTEVPPTPKRTETPGSRKLCVGCGRHQDKNTRTEQRKKEKENRPEKSPQPSGSGDVFP